MKKSLLLLGTLMLSGLSAMAQDLTAEWTKPDLPTEPTTSATWELEKSYYLWNVGAKGYYINHQGSGEPYWGTRAMVYADVATPVKITRTNPGGNAEDWTKVGVTENTGLLVSYVTSKSENRCTFYTDDGVAVWTDNNGEANRYFQVVANGSYYNIKGSPLSKVDMSSKFFAVVDENENKVVTFVAEGTDDNEKWLFIDAEPWQKVEAAEALEAAITDAENNDVPASALANDIAVYNNLSSTLQQLQDATARVKAVNSLVLAIGNAKNNGVSETALNNESTQANNPNATIDQLKEAQARVDALVALQAAIDNAIAAGVDETIIAKQKADAANANSSLDDLTKDTEHVKAVQALREAINYADEKGAAGLDQYEAILSNTSASTEQLLEAAAQVKDMARWEEIAPIFENIVQGEKNDVSGVFENNRFDNAQNNVIPDGWDITWKLSTPECTNLGGRVATYTNGEVKISNFIEAWKDNNSPNYLGDGSITQSIPSLPEGTYMLAVDCIANNQGRISDADNKDGLPDDVQLFAKASLTGKEYTQALATKNNTPEHFEFIFHHEGGSMTLGLRVIGSADAKMPANWICMDNLELYYFGTGDIDPAKAMLNGDIADALEKYPIVSDDPEAGEITLEEGKYTTQSYINDYVKTIADAQNATGDFDTHRTNIANAIKNLEAGIAAYDKFLKKWDTESTGEWQLNYAEFEFEAAEWNDFGDFIYESNTPEGYPESTPGAMLEDHLLTPEEIDNYIAQVDALYRTAFAKSLVPGTDCTALLVNASFAEPTDTKDFPGWTNNSNGASNIGVWGGLYEYPCVETYGAKVDVYQEIDNLPPGVYELRGQAFQRNQQVVYLYMNEYETMVQEQKEGALPKSEGVNKENCWYEGSFDASEYKSTGGTTNLDATVTITDKEGGEIEAWVPNGMTGSSVAFRAGRYWQSAKGLVKDGKLKVGLTSKGVAAEWMLWSSFKLIYLGEDADTYGDMLDNSIKVEEAYLAANYNEEGGTQTMTTPALNDYKTAIATAKETAKSNDADVLKQGLEDLTAASNAVKENALVWADAKTKRAALDAALADYYASETGKAEYEAAAAELAEETYINKTTAELKAAIEKMDEIITKLSYGEYEGSCDMTAKIVNPSFENETSVTTTIKGWTNDGSQGVQTQTNTSFDNKQGNTYAERWHASGTYDINQTIANLPAGRYEISAYIYSDAADCVLYGSNLLTPEGSTSVYEATTPVGVSQRYKVVVNLPEAGSLKFGVKWTDTSDRWTCIDDFKLTYYGTNDVVGIDGIDAAQPAAQKNRKVFENGRIVIYKNGQKYNVAGQAIK
ncbi:MAG: hypothetical protein J6M19_06460 [Bacteroidaceae bacterium]|nr:hypothetical protein [Bacteroidaceae bacterium]